MNRTSAKPRPTAAPQGVRLSEGRVNLKAVGRILGQAKIIATRYYRETGKPLGITGEVGEYEAAIQLHLNLTRARQAGYDAMDRAGHKFQIKARLIRSGKSNGGQIGAIHLDQPWNSVLLVLLDENFNPTTIYRAGRQAISTALKKDGSIARNVRGQLSVSKFKSIGKPVWPV